jgi:enoyl-CoA hydratase/carnithine racemase
MSTFETVLFEESGDHVATITLNRPHRLNSFNLTMMQEFKQLWRHIQDTDSIHAVVLRAAEGRAFCTGVDVHDGRGPDPGNIWSHEDPGAYLSPKMNACWKPVVTAVHGMAAGGAFYFLNESDIVICSEDATFFDPHVTFGMTSVLEPVGMTYRHMLGDVLRMVLLGNDERIGATSALQKGIVSEVVPAVTLRARAHTLAAKIAAKPTVATQGSVRAIWESLDLPRSVALRTGLKYIQLGNPIGIPQVDRAAVMRGTQEFEVL